MPETIGKLKTHGYAIQLTGKGQPPGLPKEKINVCLF
jgi:hypothetical protein